MEARERELTLKWIETWRRAGPELARIRDEELASLTDDTARRMSRDLLSTAKPGGTLSERRHTSGLVAQQVWFQKLAA